ncbi:MAG: carbohydrate ABC transporter permease [Spartobacteria bacterium]
MKVWKAALLLAALAAVIWWLSPQRAIKPNEPGVVEINFTGDAGANKAALDEAFLAFETESRALHEKDPHQPIYRVIAGQSASRDQTADPLEDAARLDGCGFFRIYWHIMLPLVRPTLAAIAIFTFLATWNEFTMPLIYLANQRIYPLSFGLYAFQVQVSIPGTAKGMGMVMAASFLIMLPVIAIFLFAQRYFLRGSP